jgi:hypothetical protein
MRNTTKTMLAIVSLLTISSTAMAAETSHRSHRAESRAAAAMQYDAQVQGPGLRYDPSTYAFEPTFDPGQTLFDRAKGGID